MKRWPTEEKKLLGALIRKLRTVVSHIEFDNGRDGIDFTFKDKAEVKVTRERDFILCLECKRKNVQCEDTGDHRIFVCPNLPRDLVTLADGRSTYLTKKVGRYLYKYMPNRSGNSYWYIQSVENGKPLSIYLGAAAPAFVPEQDIEIANSRKQAKSNRSLKAQTV